MSGGLVVANDPINSVDPYGLYEKDFQFLADKTITVDISDTMTSDQQALAESEIGGAASLTMGMESAGTLPSSSSDAINALGSMSVSGDIAGYNPDTGNFNMNIGEMQTDSANQAAYPGASVAVTASKIVHDGTHAVQNAAGQLPQNSFASVPTDPGQRATFNSMVVGTERAANQVQGQFLNAVPGLPGHVSGHLSGTVTGMTSSDIMSRYCGRDGGC